METLHRKRPAHYNGASIISTRAQFVLAAATIPCVGTKSTHENLKKLLPSASYITSNNVHSTVAGLDRRFRHVTEVNKGVALLQELEEQAAAPGNNGDSSGPMLVFANSSARVDSVAQALRDEGHECGVLHSGVSVDDRVRTISALRDGSLGAVVCTDIAARGLDLPSVRTVIEYDFALNVADHMHRAGRTARAGASGRLVCFVTARDQALASAVAASAGHKVDALFSRNRMFRRRIKRERKAAKSTASSGPR